ncbi:MAG: hypothetical protein C0501_18910 [Isosphaera sp.]|nr:hypothetical protein [Isosphaera sp.]
MFVTRTVIAAALAAALVGCAEGPKTRQIQGQVVWADGTPAAELAGAVVVLTPTDPAASRSGANGSGPIEADGSFRLSTFKPGDGALFGEHKAVIVQTITAEDKQAAARKRVLPARYSLHDGSDLRVTVGPDTDKVMLTLERK